MNKITFVNNTSPLLSAENLNQIQDNVESAINSVSSSIQPAVYEANTYSTTETRIGTWINDKPIYRKVINFGNLPNNNVKRVNHNISNMDRVTRLTGITQVDLGGTYGLTWNPLPLIYSGSEYIYNTTLSCNKTEIVCRTAQDRSGFSAYIIIEYTKTTD